MLASHKTFEDANLAVGRVNVVPAKRQTLALSRTTSSGGKVERPVCVPHWSIRTSSKNGLKFLVVEESVISLNRLCWPLDRGSNVSLDIAAFYGIGEDAV